MKKIYNWERASVSDIETDGLLDTISKIHIVGVQLDGRSDVTLLDGKNHDRIKSMLTYHIDNEIPIVGHNFISFDVPAFEKVLGIDLSKLMVIDTMVLSWYLNVDKERHSIEELAKDYPEASKKYQIDPDQWETLDWDEAVKRVTSDVEINKIIWEDFKSRLIDMYSLGKEQIDSGNVGGLRVSEDEILSIDQFRGDSVEEHINRILSFLMFQADVSRLQEETGWEVDVDMVTSESEKLKILLDESKKELESVMPVVAKYAKRTPPKNPFKKNGELSVSGEAWEERKAKLGKFDEYGNPLAEVREVGSIHELVKYEAPNINSHDQVKAFLFSKGWQPKTFKYERDKEAFDEWVKSKPPQGSKRGAWKVWSESRPEDRAIPQINKEDEDRNKELCDSVLELAEEVPEIKALANYSVISHRYNFLVGNKGIIKNTDSRGKVAARLGGLASTLRWKHRGLTNLPKADKPFSSSIRGCLVAGKGNVSIGSDLSSLEDRIKHHFMMAHDPEYVKTMLADGYDPHIAMAITAGMITEGEAKYYFDNKSNKEDDIVQKVDSARSKGKTCLPVDTTEVLTNSGWKKWGKITLEDQVVSYNNETGKTQFGKILDTVFFKESEVVELSVGKSWRVESTLDHRWLVEVRRGDNGNRRMDEEYKTTSDLRGDVNIITSKEFEGGLGDVSVYSARALGWILADGYLDASEPEGVTSQGSDSRRQLVNMSCAQKGKFLEEMIEDFEKAGLKFSINSNRSDGVVTVSFSSPSAREWLKSIGLPLTSKHKIDYTTFVLNLSKEAREGLLETFYKGDGYLTTGYKTKVMGQNYGNIIKAIQLCYELSGKSTILRKSDEKFCILRARNRGHVTAQRIKEVGRREVDVFCLTTELGNFVIRQGDVITITGNCNYASVYNAGAATIARAAGVDIDEGKLLHEAYWNLNWAVKAIAEEQIVLECSRGLKWLVNPINGFLYTLRTEKDRFSALCQGTGSFMFDMWVDRILTKMEERWGRKTMTAQFHKTLWL